MNTSEVISGIHACLNKSISPLPQNVGTEDIFSDLGMDSLSFMVFLINLEKQFNVKLSPIAAELKLATTVGDLVTLLQKIKNQ